MCPIHVQPSLRAREEALETAGYIQALDSQGVTNQKNAESAGVGMAKQPPKTEYHFDNVDYIPV